LFDTTIEENITYGVNEKDLSKEDLDMCLKMSGCNDFIENKHRFPEGLKTIVGERG
jgi:ABC-type multidrug transport system fused ATPase/permease subunit